MFWNWEDSSVFFLLPWEGVRTFASNSSLQVFFPTSLTEIWEVSLLCWIKHKTRPFYSSSLPLIGLGFLWSFLLSTTAGRLPSAKLFGYVGLGCPVFYGWVSVKFSTASFSGGLGCCLSTPICTKNCYFVSRFLFYHNVLSCLFIFDHDKHEKLDRWLFGQLCRIPCIKKRFTSFPLFPQLGAKQELDCFRCT